MQRSVSLFLFVLLATSFFMDESRAQPRYGSGSSYGSRSYATGSYGPSSGVTTPGQQSSGQTSQTAGVTTSTTTTDASRYTNAATQSCNNIALAASCHCKDPVTVLADAVSEAISQLGSEKPQRFDSECFFNSLALGSFSVECKARTESAIAGGVFSKGALHCWCTSEDISLAVTSSDGQLAGNLLKTNLFQPGDSLNAIFKKAEQDVDFSFVYNSNDCNNQSISFNVDGQVGGKMDFAADYAKLFDIGAMRVAASCDLQGFFGVDGQLSCHNKFWEGGVRGRIGNTPQGSFGGAKVFNSFVYPSPRCNDLKLETWAELMYNTDGTNQGARLRGGGAAGCSLNAQW